MKSKQMVFISLVAALIMASCFSVGDVGLINLQKVEAFVGPISATAETTDKTLTVTWDGMLEENESFFVVLNGDCRKVNGHQYTFENLEPDTMYRVDVYAVNPYIQEGLLGDVNLDGCINSLDFAWLRTYLLTDTIPITEQMVTDKNGDGVINQTDTQLIESDCLSLADVNRDNYIDAIDFAMMKKKLLNGDNYFFPGCVWYSNGVTKYTKTKEDFDGGFIQISSSRTHTAALRQDGTVWTWGLNRSGQLGDGTDKNRAMPIKVDISGVKQVETIDPRTVVVKEDGTVWSWGSSIRGQLGNGTTDWYAYIPVKADITGVKAVAVYDSYTLALKEDGTVWRWGGYPPPSDIQYYDEDEIIGLLRPSPLGISGVKAMSAAEGYVVVLKEDGTVWGFGNSTGGQLGSLEKDGYNKNLVQIEGISGVKAVDAGKEFLVVLKDDGTVWTWGYNYSGQLGNGTTIKSTVPVKVDISDVKKVAAGDYHAIALKEDGTVWAWGKNDKGELGNGTTSNSSVPIQTMISEVKEIDASNSFSIAIKKDNTVWEWGLRRIVQSYELDTIESRSIPVQKNF